MTHNFRVKTIFVKNYSSEKNFAHRKKIIHNQHRLKCETKSSDAI